MFKSLNDELHNKPKTRQWLWFIGLYASSIAAIAAFSYLARSLLA